MPKYHVLVHGDHCLMPGEESQAPNHVGLYTSCFVEARDVREAIARAVPAVGERLREEGATQGSPVYVAERIREVSALRAAGGSVYYESGDADAQYDALLIEARGFLPWWQRWLPTGLFWTQIEYP